VLLALQLALLACAQPESGREGARPHEAAPFAKPPIREVRWPRPGPDLQGTCDASTATALPRGGFLVGDDEHNRLFSFDADGAPHPPLELPFDGKELDLEGSARAADGIWWVASHDRGKGTEPKPSRQHLLRTDDAGTVLADHTDLWSHLVQHAVLGPLLRATEGTTSKDVSGFSVEALHVDGASIWLGLRAPIVDGKALLVQLDPASRAVGTVHFVDLGGRGFRALEPHGSALYGIAGPADDDGDFRLFTLELPAARPVLLDIDVGSIRPEGLVSLPEGLLAISDDGKVDRSGTPCRDLPQEARFARTLWVVAP